MKWVFKTILACILGVMVICIFFGAIGFIAYLLTRLNIAIGTSVADVIFLWALLAGTIITALGIGFDIIETTRLKNWFGKPEERL